MSRSFSLPVGLFSCSPAGAPSSFVHSLTCVLLLLLTVGCFDEPTAPDEGANVEESRAVEPSQGVQGLVGQPSFLELADQIPAFGGFFFNDQGDIVVYLTDPEQLDAIRPLIQEKVAGRLDGLGAPAGMGQRFVVREADYSFRELAAYRTRLRDEILGISGVVSLDVDETENQINIGVVQGVPPEELLARLQNLQIPSQAVTYSEESYPTAGSHTVQEQHPGEKIEGGWEITGPGLCTLGFPAVRDPSGEEVFLTASHCSEVRYGPDNSEWYQPDANFPPRVGIETEDPDGFTCDGLPCRYSDVSLVTAEKAFDLGRVATTKFSGGSDGSGSLEIYHDHPRWFASGQSSGNFVGERVDKVGRTTGWTHGQVNETCVDTNVDENDDDIGDYTVLCSDRADYHSGSGDSGSPVFFIHADSTIDMRGIHFAGDDGNGNRSFSPLGQIRRDMGSLIAYETPTVSVTIDGPTEVPENTECTWSANVSGGLPPYSYEWLRDGAVVSTTDSYTGDSGISDFRLDLEVVDGRNDMDTDVLFVTVTSGEDETGSCPA